MAPLAGEGVPSLTDFSLGDCDIKEVLDQYSNEAEKTHQIIRLHCSVCARCQARRAELRIAVLNKMVDDVRICSVLAILLLRTIYSKLSLRTFFSDFEHVSLLMRVNAPYDIENTLAGDVPHR